jgi:sugar phosphate permease
MAIQPPPVPLVSGTAKKKIVLWIVTIIGSVLGGLTFLAGIVAANGAPQEAAAAAMGVAFAVIPYCLARAVSEIGKN